ncbi:MAG: hypothetical protein JRI45_01020 [Deltaproteobacteria bacterium]|nr:hypothetical protein [Deltaproteobacteria bacterium]MBW2067486.1 hypothetical protein [Deltaproteobacteria bacterium]
MVKRPTGDDDYMEDMDEEVNAGGLGEEGVELGFDDEEELLLDEDVGIDDTDDVGDEIPSVLLSGVIKPKTVDDWRNLLKKASPEGVPEYRITESYREGDLLVHREFGFGVVSKVKSPKKIQVVFENDERLLAMNTVPPEDE